MVASEALASGVVTRQQLRARYVQLHRDVYAPREIELTARVRALAAWLWSRREATLVGNSAAAMLGTKWISADEPAELGRSRFTSAAGIIVRSGAIAEDELCMRRGIPCTTAARTAYDVGRFMLPDKSIVRIDALLNATGCRVDDVAAIAGRYPKARGIRRLRAALELSDGGAESPQETRLRLILVRGGLPRLRAQIPVANEWGRVVRRVDMGWSEWMVGVEYDGEQHWTDPKAYEDDIDRLEFLAAKGWLIVRVSARHMRAPDEVVRRASVALKSRGWSPRLQKMTKTGRKPSASEVSAPRRT
jgi:very-short-patch-repair endonuclease